GARGLPRIEELAVGPGRPEDGGVVTVHHGEAPRQTRLHRDVLGEVVTERETVVPGARSEEPEVPLLAARAPAVPGVVVQAATERIGLVPELPDVRGGGLRPRGVAEGGGAGAGDPEVPAGGGPPPAGVPRVPP